MMNEIQITQNPWQIKAAGGTRAGLLIAAMQGLFQAAGLTHPPEGEDVRETFELQANDPQTLILQVLRHASQMAASKCESYDEINFALITDKQAKGEFVGRKIFSCPPIPAVLGIDGDIIKGDDGLWRATIALGKQ